MSEVTVGIDIGTTSVKALAVDGEGQVLARTRIPHPLRFPEPDQMEHDAARAWRRGPRRALRETVAALGGQRPRAVAVAGMVPSFTAVNARGVPQTPGLLYGDARGRGLDPQARTGTGGEALGFLAWTARAAPDAAGYWPAQAVANHALAGRAVMDLSAAGAANPLFDFRAFTWSAAQLERCGVDPARMPEVKVWGEAIGEHEGVVVASGLVDAMGEQIVAGADDVGDVLVLCGGTLLTWVVVSEQVEVPGLHCIPHTTPGKFLVGGPSNAGGLFLDWAASLLRPGARGEHPDPGRVPVWAPYPRGERVPLDDPHRRATLDGLDLTHGPAALRRSRYEASAFVVRRVIESSGVTPRRLVVTGGGVRDPEWMAALADVTGVPAELTAVPEGAARGAAWTARMAAGLEDDLAAASRWARVGERVEPDPRWAGPVAERYARFLRLSPLVAPSPGSVLDPAPSASPGSEPANA